MGKDNPTRVAKAMLVESYRKVLGAVVPMVVNPETEPAEETNLLLFCRNGTHGGTQSGGK